MASPAALREWCRVACAGYPGVEIKDWSTSFRDGRALCAIIHRHRPDLIDFSSLSKDDAYQNNKLAFEIAETNLGIPALLDPKAMVSCKVPDCLGVITYVSQYYTYFNSKSCAGPASLKSSHITALNNFTKTKRPDGLKPLQSSTRLETSKGQLTSTNPQTVCKLCFRPVHLMQRRLVNGEIYHRSCFRCKVCNCTLLQGFYTQGSDAGSLICTDHVRDSKSTSVDFSQQIGSAHNQPKCTFGARYVSLSGLAISSVPHYTMKTESQDKLVCETAKTEEKERQKRSREVKDKETPSVGLSSMVQKPAPLHLPSNSGKGRTGEGAEQGGPEPTVTDGKLKQEVNETPHPSELSSTCARVAEGSGRPVPAPRRMLDSPSVPVPAPRVKTLQTTSRCAAAGTTTNQCKSPPISPNTTSPASGNPKVKSNHPWLGIIHSGPWTQLPPAPPPVFIPQSKSFCNLPRYRPRVPPPNPFIQEADEEGCEEATKCQPAGHTQYTESVCHSESGGNLTNESGDTEHAVCSGDAEKMPVKSHNKGEPLDKPIRPKRQDTANANTAESSSELAGNTIRGTEATAAQQDTSDEAQSRFLPRSVSVPTIASTHFQSSSQTVGLTETNESGTLCQSKQACKENSFNSKPAMTKSQTFQALPSQRAPAPGHGFPLIKRKVQTDQTVSTEDPQVEMGELNKQLEALEQRGVELEKNLRDSKNVSQKEEEQMLMEWFSLIHERSVLMCRDTELVYLRKQQKLEEKQADVEYDLRCLLNKPDSDWSQEDRNREQQLMDELVCIIEQRNQIISSLDQDRQREREEDVLWETMMTNKGLHKEGLKELKKSKGKLKPLKVFKMLSHKAVSTQNYVDKKS